MLKLLAACIVYECVDSSAEPVEHPFGAVIRKTSMHLDDGGKAAEGHSQCSNIKGDLEGYMTHEPSISAFRLTVRTSVIFPPLNFLSSSEPAISENFEKSASGMSS